MADHGQEDHRDYFPERKIAQRTRYLPFLMIKNRFESHDIIFDSSAMSSIFIKDILRGVYSGEHLHNVIKRVTSQSVREIYIRTKCKAIGNLENLFFEPVVGLDDK